CDPDTAIVTGSDAAIASATEATVSWAGLAPSRQLSGRSGQAIQQPACDSNSPGMRYPSCAGVVSSVALMGVEKIAAREPPLARATAYSLWRGRGRGSDREHRCAFIAGAHARPAASCAADRRCAAALA